MLDDLNSQERLILTRHVVAMLDEWGVSDSDQISVLGLPEGTRTRMMRKFRKDTPLPDEFAVNERVGHLLGIADALRTSYPRNASGAGLWMNRVNYRFADRTPLQAIIADGLRGLQEVRVHLDCAYDWHVHGD